MLCQFTAFSAVVEGIFGGGEAKPEYTDLAKAPTLDAALANINSALKYG